MGNFYKNFKSALVIVGITAAGFANAQCPTITCPANITVNNDAGSCDALVTYTAPVGTDSCNTNSQTFGYSGSVQSFTVPSGVTSITIDAKGAQGGSNNGGLGARMMGTFTVTPGEVIGIAVGGQGTTNACGGAPSTGGGGGGSFAWRASNTTSPLIAAGGGGGGNVNWTGACTIGLGGVTTVDGTASNGGHAVGGINGNGGAGNAPSGCGSGGGGWLTAGQNSTYGTGCTGGAAALSFAGGLGSTSFGPGGDGGFGGGGGAVCGAGGGGGYSGGGGGEGSSCRAGGGGGGSYNAGTNQSNTASFQSGNGEIVISWSGGGTTTALSAGLGSGSTFPIGTTTETYMVTNSLGDTAICSFTVTVTLPTVSIDAFTTDTICVNHAAVALPAGTPFGGTYSGTGVTGNNFDPGVSGAGSFWIVYTDSSGCNSDSTQITVNACTGIDENEEYSNLSIFPNPNNGQFTMHITNSNVTELEVKIMNIQGQVIYFKNSFENVSVVNEQLDLNNNARGIYFVSIKTDKGVITKKLIVQ